MTERFGDHAGSGARYAIGRYFERIFAIVISAFALVALYFGAKYTQ